MGSADRGVALGELIAVEFELRAARGESPSVDEYLKRFANDDSTVELAFRQGVSGLPVDAQPIGGLPQRIGEFRILREIGRGGMGIV